MSTHRLAAVQRYNSGGHDVMQFNPKALLVLVGFGVLLAMALSSNGGSWFHFGEAVASAVIVLSLAGLLSGSRKSAR